MRASDDEQDINKLRPKDTKNRNFKKMKILLEISSFHTSALKTKII